MSTHILDTSERAERNGRNEEMHTLISAFFKSNTSVILGSSVNMMTIYSEMYNFLISFEAFADQTFHMQLFEFAIVIFFLGDRYVNQFLTSLPGYHNSYIYIESFTSIFTLSVFIGFKISW